MKFEQMLKQNVSKDLKKFSHLLQYLRSKMISVAPLSRRFLLTASVFSVTREKPFFPSKHMWKSTFVDNYHSPSTC